MYLQHFGLNSKPFGATAEGTAVFVSPRQSEQIKALHKGLGAQDAVVTVTGPVGVGKTTFVGKGLELIHPGRLVATVGRMKLEPEELFELLLAGFGVGTNAKGTIRQIGAFRRFLHERAATGVQVAIVVEDAHRVGIDALVELEALTAADSGATSSANIILMGQPGLWDLLSKPDLARMKQRVRLRQEIEPLSAAEVQGYLKHALRQAGGEYESIFDAGVADILSACSEGIPRVINTLCEEALMAAMDENQARVTPTLMAQIAESTFGYAASVSVPVVSAPLVSTDKPETQSSIEGRSVADDDVDWESPPRQPEPEPLQVHAFEPAAVADLPVKPDIGHDIVVESGSYPAKTQNTAEPLASRHSAGIQHEPATEESKTDASDVADDFVAAAEAEESLIPDLINDTQPELRQLAEPADHATTLTDIDPVIATPAAMSAGAAKAPESDSGDTQTIKTIGGDPDAALLTKATAVEDDSVEDDIDYGLDDALAIDADSTNVMEALTPDLDSIATDKSAAESAKDEPELPVLPKDTELSSSAMELPTLSNSMRVEVAQESKSAEQHESAPAAAERTDDEQDNEPQSAASAEADTPGELDEEAAMLAELEMAYALEQQEVAAAEAAAAESAVSDKNEPVTPAATDPGIFDELDPLPDLDALGHQVDEVHAEPLADSRADTGELTVTDLTVSGIAKKSRQDIGALEDALEAAKNGETSASLTIEPQTAPKSSEPSSKADAPAADIPEITLDQAISSEQPKKAEFDKFAAEIGTANSLEDFSDAMAETLFGSEAFDQIAAEVVANPPDAETSAVEELDKQSPVKLDESDMPGAANDAVEQEVTELSLEKTGEQPAVEEKPAAKVTAPKAAAPKAAAPKHKAPRVPTLLDGGDVPLNESVAMRMEILNKMKNNVANMATENVELGESVSPPPARQSHLPKPESIEDQIDTSITQTLKAVDIARMDAEAAAEEKVEKKSGGLFSRFRKSS